MTSAVASDSDIQFVWSIVSNMEDEDDLISQQLLASILKEWVVLRGHSICSHFMEEYKRLHAQTKKKKSLRRELKRKEATSKKDATSKEENK